MVFSFFFFFPKHVSLCNSPGCSGIHRDWPASATQELGLKAWATIVWLDDVFNDTGIFSFSQLHLVTASIEMVKQSLKRYVELEFKETLLFMLS